MTRARTMIRAADLFCGAGGTSQGLVQACDAAGATVDLFEIAGCGCMVDEPAEVTT